jgi:hypothetical protein
MPVESGNKDMKVTDRIASFIYRRLRDAEARRTAFGIALCWPQCRD